MTSPWSRPETLHLAEEHDPPFLQLHRLFSMVTTVALTYTYKLHLVSVGKYLQDFTADVVWVISRCPLLQQFF
eukprot:CAMPEP_0180382978 /NCGR_PEP_ID=MMETSP0989-20121125/27672_1 /TAXON_ID=697907 /ORGANISM="non described non described, Strain CCMP2293" /LENGTH=72 /DNA_ID=CAMNT_0022383167 /DNA_START=337 /DNA_END=552 /DNA_ORIENTATION=-